MRKRWIAGGVATAVCLAVALGGALVWAEDGAQDRPQPAAPAKVETAADWPKHVGDLPFVIGEKAGKEEAAFAGRALMYFFVSKKDKWCRIFAKRTFTNETVLKRVAAYTPVLVELEKHEKLAAKFPIAVLPSVIWAEADDETIFMAQGDVPLEIFLTLAEIAEDRAPDVKPTEGWLALSKLADEVDRQVEAGETQTAFATIVKIQAVRLGAPFQARARAAGDKLTAKGSELIAEAEALYATKRPKKRKAAREILDALIVEYGGHPVGVRAAELRKLDGRKPRKKPAR